MILKSISNSEWNSTIKMSVTMSVNEMVELTWPAVYTNNLCPRRTTESHGHVPENRRPTIVHLMAKLHCTTR